jgi:hypothetical protein
LGALCCLICALLFCRWCQALLPHLEESAFWSIFASVVLSHCPCLRGPRLALSSDLILAFVWLLITYLRFLFFSFSFFSELFTMCVVNALLKGETEDRSIQGPMDGRSLVWWVIDNVVWTDS